MAFLHRISDTESNGQLPKTEDEMSPELKSNYKKVRRIDFLSSVVAFLIVSTIVASNFLVAIVPTGSMYPTLAVKEFGIVRRMDPENLQHSNICVFHFNDFGRKAVFCKRLIGIPGNTVEIKDNVLYLNGEPQIETYCAENMLTQDMPEILLDEDEYFLMGDNRNNSADCRVFGPVKGEDLIGRVIYHHQFFRDPELDIFYQNQPNNANPAFIDPKPDHPKIVKH